MSTALLVERSATGIAPISGSGPSTFPGTSPAGTSWCVVPRCKLEFKKTTGGFKITCHCDDEVATGTLQNLCRMLADGLCSCICTCNGITVCQCNFTLGICKCEMTKDGCTISCTSGDKSCGAILQSCCDCLETCCQSGCCCYISFNNTPVCCGSC